MIRTHINNQPSGLASLVADVRCDAFGAIRNGAPFIPYVPKDPGRRERLFALLRESHESREVTR